MRFLIRTEIETAPCSLNQECVARRYLDNPWAAGQMCACVVGRSGEAPAAVRNQLTCPRTAKPRRWGHSESAEPKTTPGIKHLWVFTH